MLLRGFAPAAGDYSGAGPAAARAGNSAARRHVHADAEQRLPVAGERPREDGARDPAAFARGRRGVRRIQQVDGADVPVREAPPLDDSARSDFSESARPEQALFPLQAIPGAFLRRTVHICAAHDDERGGVSGPVVRDGRAESDDVRLRDHRHVSRRSFAGHGVRATASLHGRN